MDQKEAEHIDTTITAHNPTARNNTCVLWTAPRCISTAFERAMMERKDCCCLHEPFSDSYYFSQDAKSKRYVDLIDDEVRLPEHAVNSHRDYSFMATWEAVYNAPLLEEPYSTMFIKDMAYTVVHNLTAVPLAPNVQHSFLIRDPKKSIPSLWRKCCDSEGTGTRWTYFDESETGFEELYTVWQHVIDSNRHTSVASSTPIIVDADDLLTNPRKVLDKYCTCLGLPKVDKDLSQWEQKAVPDWGLWSPWHEEAEKSTGISSKHTSSTTSSSAIHTIQQEGTHKGEKVDADEEEKEEEEEIDQSLPEEVRRAIAKALPFYREMYACRMRVGCEP